MPMSLLKSEVKISTLLEVGKRLEDVFEANKQNLYIAEGEKRGLLFAKKKIEDFVSEHLGPTFVDSVGVETAEVAKRNVGRCIGILENLAISSELGIAKQTGRVQGLEQAVHLVKKTWEAEREKLEALLAKAEEMKRQEKPPEVAEAEPQHPGLNVAQQRKEEAVLEEVVATTAASEKIVEPPKEALPEQAPCQDPTPAPAEPPPSETKTSTARRPYKGKSAKSD